MKLQEKEVSAYEAEYQTAEHRAGIRGFGIKYGKV